jgi:F-type H+-transporting ATPase subunit beta
MSTATANATDLKEGRVIAIAGPVIDVEFPRGSLPELNQALEFTITVDGKDTFVLAEVAQQLGNSRVRAVCMKPTDGLKRGTAKSSMCLPIRRTAKGLIGMRGLRGAEHPGPWWILRRHHLG